MKHLIQEVGDYQLYAELTDVAPEGTRRLVFSSVYAESTNPREVRNTFEVFLTPASLDRLSTLLNS